MENPRSQEREVDIMVNQDAMANVAKPVTPVKPAAAERKEPLAPTLKFLRNKTRIGPVSIGISAKASLPKAAGRILFDNNLKVVIKQADGTSIDANSVKDDSRKPLVKLIKLTKGQETEDATLYMLAWDKKYHQSVGTDNYVKKCELFVKQQQAVYDSLGVPFAPGGKGKKPELTEQQKRQYNERMRPYAFSYYEYRLSFKTPGMKAVRSLTYRSLKQFDEDKVISELAEIVKKLREGLVITTKSTS
jgi:hypothetical protein